MEQGQVQARRGLRVVALAGAEAELAEADHAPFGAEGLLRVGDRMGEKLFGPGVARVRAVHDRGGEPGHAHGAGRADDGPGQRVGRVGQLVARRSLVGVDEDASVLDLHRVARDPVFLEAGLALSGTEVELVVVPGADDVVAVEAPFAEGAAHVVADPGDGGEHAVAAHQRDRGGPGADGGDGFACRALRPSPRLATSLRPWGPPSPDAFEPYPGRVAPRKARNG